MFHHALVYFLVYETSPAPTACSYRVFERSASMPTRWHFNLICQQRSGRVVKAEGLALRAPGWQRTIRWGRLSCNLAAFQYVKAATGRGTHSHKHNHKHTHTLSHVKCKHATPPSPRATFAHTQKTNAIKFSFLCLFVKNVS